MLKSSDELQKRKHNRRRTKGVVDIHNYNLCMSNNADVYIVYAHKKMTEVNVCDFLVVGWMTAV